MSINKPNTRELLKTLHGLLLGQAVEDANIAKLPGLTLEQRQLLTEASELEFEQAEMVEFRLGQEK